MLRSGCCEGRLSSSYNWRGSVDGGSVVNGCFRILGQGPENAVALAESFRQLAILLCDPAWGGTFAICIQKRQHIGIVHIYSAYGISAEPGAD